MMTRGAKVAVGVAVIGTVGVVGILLGARRAHASPRKFKVEDLFNQFVDSIDDGKGLFFLRHDRQFLDVRDQSVDPVPISAEQARAIATQTGALAFWQAKGLLA